MRVVEMARHESLNIGSRTAETFSNFVFGANPAPIIIDSVDVLIASTDRTGIKILDALHEIRNDLCKGESDTTYYAYHAFHSSSGYCTEFLLSDSDEIITNVIRPKGIGMQAFFSETVILKKEKIQPIEPVCSELSCGEVNEIIGALGDMIYIVDDFLSLLETMEPEDTGRNIESIRDTYERSLNLYKNYNNNMK